MTIDQFPSVLKVENKIEPVIYVMSPNETETKSFGIHMFVDLSILPENLRQQVVDYLKFEKLEITDGVC